MTLIIGLTGGIASGKSTVSNMLKGMGYPIIDADMEARNVVEPGELAYKQIVHNFGKEVLLANEKIDRVKLGHIIFHDEDKRKLLNEIVHPAVRQRMLSQKEMLVARQMPLIIMDIPLLFESNLIYMVDKTLLVYVDKDVQIKRLMERNSLTREEALARIQSQMPLKEKIPLADAVIDNNGSIEKTKAQLKEILTRFNGQ